MDPISLSVSIVHYFAFLSVRIAILIPFCFLNIGVNNENYMQPAPYKVSDPRGAEMVKPVDAAALRKESWILG